MGAICGEMPLHEELIERLLKRFLYPLSDVVCDQVNRKIHEGVQSEGQQCENVFVGGRNKASRNHRGGFNHA